MFFKQIKNFKFLFFTKNKRSQANQVFIYILSVIIIGIILLFGYRAISQFGEKAEQVSYIKFKTDIQSIVRTMSSDYGSVKREEFIVGSVYKQICFVDSDATVSTLSDDIHPVIKDMVGSGVDKNTFLMTDSIEESFNVGKLEVDDDGPDSFICINSINGRIKVEFEGLGDRTKIREWQ